jgi:hypothetical protein
MKQIVLDLLAMTEDDRETWLMNRQDTFDFEAAYKILRTMRDKEMSKVSRARGKFDVEKVNVIDQTVAHLQTWDKQFH